jgi:hypothetical protein
LTELNAFTRPHVTFRTNSAVSIIVVEFSHIALWVTESVSDIQRLAHLNALVSHLNELFFANQAVSIVHIVLCLQALRITVAISNLSGFAELYTLSSQLFVSSFAL